MYYDEDKVVGSDGKIYECIDTDFCDEDPLGTWGKKGWEATAFETKGIKNYNKSAKPEKKWLDMTTWNANVPFNKGDNAKTGGKYYKCEDTDKCRKSKAGGASATTGWKEDKTGGFDVKNKAKLPPAKQMQIQCEEVDNTKKDYKKDDIVGEKTGTFKSAWKCVNDACDGTKLEKGKGWKRLRLKADI